MIDYKLEARKILDEFIDAITPKLSVEETNPQFEEARDRMKSDPITEEVAKQAALKHMEKTIKLMTYYDSKLTGQLIEIYNALLEI